MTTCKYADWTHGQEEALKNILGGDEVCRRILARTVKVTIQETEDSVLEFVGTITTPATTEQFVARDKFVISTDPKALVKINYLSGNFTSWFLSGAGKTEDPIGEQTLRYAKLRKASLDIPIIAELGGEAKAETTLTEVYALMAKKAKGGDGVLLNNDWANIFYVKGQNGLLRTVYLRWHDDSWDVDACSIRSLSTWGGGRHVFSRNS